MVRGFRVQGLWGFRSFVFEGGGRDLGPFRAFRVLGFAVWALVAAVGALGVWCFVWGCSPKPQTPKPQTPNPKP